MSPIAPLSAAMVLGVVLGTFWPGLAALALCATGLALLGHGTAVARRRGLAAAGAAALSALATGFALGTSAAGTPVAWKAADHVLVGEVERAVSREDGRVGVVLGLERAGLAAARSPLAAVDGEAWLWAPGAKAASFRPGDVVLVRVRSPAVLQRARASAAIGGDSRALSAGLVAGPLVVRPRGLATGCLETVRTAVRRGLEAALEGPALGLAEALVLGDRSRLAEREQSIFRRTGTAHLLAVSGLHVAIVTGLLLFAATRLLLWTPLARRGRVAVPASLLAAAGCWGYAALTGLAPPVFRAAVMATAALSALALGRPRSALRSVALAAALLVALEPDLLGRPGFQLSFAAVLGLLALSSRWSGPKPVAPWARLGQGLARAASTSAVASLVTAPLVAHHFGTASPSGLLVNVVAVPAMTAVVLPTTLLVAVTATIAPGLGAAIAPVARAPMLAFLAGLRWVSELPGASVPVPRPTLLEALLASMGVILAVGRHRRGRRAGLALLAIVAGSVALRANAPALTGRLGVTFLAVGDGDATVVDLPRGGRLLVDTGPEAGTIDRPPPAVEALERSGLGRLEALVLTHGHADHGTGVPAVLARVGARELWTPLPGTGAELGPFESLARARGGRVRHARELCGVHRLGSVRLEVLHPCEGRTEGLEENDRSLVLRLVYGRVAVLLPGDIEAEGEAALLRLPPGSTRATVLKLPHHGSATSSGEALLDAVRPEVAVASCGRSRGRPLPHPEVARRLRQRGVLVLSTAEHGAVRVSTDGEDLRVEAARLGHVRGPRVGLGERALRGLGP